MLSGRVGLGLILAWLAVVLIMWILGVGPFAAATAGSAFSFPTR